MLTRISYILFVAFLSLLAFAHSKPLFFDDLFGGRDLSSEEHYGGDHFGGN